MHFKGEINSVTTEFSRMLEKNARIPIAILSKDPYADQLMAQSVKKFRCTRGQNNPIVLSGETCSCDWAETLVLGGGLFFAQEIYLVLMSERLDRDVVKILAKHVRSFREQGVLFFFSKEEGRYQEMRELCEWSFSLRPPRPNELGAYLDFWCQQFNIKLSEDAHEFMLLRYSSCFEQMAGDLSVLSGKSDDLAERIFTISDLQEQLPECQLPFFELMQAFFLLRRQSFFYSTLLNYEGQWDVIRPLLAHLQWGLMQIHGILHGGKAVVPRGQQEQLLQQAAPLWAKSNLQKSLATLAEWELRVRKRDPYIWNIFHLKLCQWNSREIKL